MNLDTDCQMHGSTHPEFLCSDSRKSITYPYMPPVGIIEYVPISNPFMALARAYARVQSRDAVMPGAAVVVKDNRVIGMGANGSDYHSTRQCERVLRGCKSGEGYELCEGCHPKNHSERTAVADARNRLGKDAVWFSNLYLWGHWWCCEPCWEAMNGAGILRVFLLEDSEMLFNKEDPHNIVGKQFLE